MNAVISVAKDVLRRAARVGLEAAGEKIFGAKGWELAKDVFTPVFDKLGEQFPALKAVGTPEAEAEAEKAAEALEQNEALRESLVGGFSKLEQGQDLIMRALFNLNQDLQRISASIDKGFEAAHDDRQALRKLMQHEFQALNLELGKGAVAAQADEEVLTVQEIYADANAYQQDAMKWISAGKAKFAGQRLRSAYALVGDGLKQEPDSTNLLVTLGYIEKSQAQVQQIVGDPQAAAAHLAEAGKVFAKVVQAESSNVSALNGMANIYLFAEDYDRAIAIGEWLFAVDPEYGAAIWDLALALEKKRAQSDDPGVKKQLVTVYQHLLGLMPKQPQTFPANYLLHVQNRLKALGALPGEAAQGGAGALL